MAQATQSMQSTQAAEWTSQIYPGEIVIDDNTREEHFAPTHVDGEPVSYGLEPRDFEARPLGSLKYAPAFDLPLIPQNEWIDIIKEMEAEKSRLSDVIISQEIPPKDQNGTNFCWYNGPTGCFETVRAANNEPYIELSPASGAAQIKGYRNQGGLGIEAIEWMAEHGTAAASLWPPNAIKKQYKTAESDENAKLHLALKWFDLQPRNIDQLMTCLLKPNRRPVACGYNWQGHETYAVDALYLGNGKFGTRNRNSWKGYSYMCFYVLTDQRMLPDDAQALWSVSLSAK